jgi:hypothetical protein
MITSKIDALQLQDRDFALLRGDVGTAVLVHGNGAAFEVEFVGYDGHTVALLTLQRAQVRPLQTHDIPHARELAHA